ncbi:hypothetical protein LY90DRAFT_671228 [Neocallimastix californiae]|uniref:L domain-like protein n=1 Tax=Neocallimastix californiae TaxID=1754190 RepID=A0A1Y2CJD1_9FUNG|nr:hypothetical protein LY90DRAFT_671228 [Neocallimastix californiae]|eukprot:ORY47139.1 hypothetical protein LY90DRAFT_671228 [Neocallimastix californiae]
MIVENLKENNISCINNEPENENKYTENENNKYFKSFDTEIDKLINLEEEHILHSNNKNLYNNINEKEHSIHIFPFSLNELNVSLNSIINEENLYSNKNDQNSNTEYDESVFDYKEQNSDNTNIFDYEEPKDETNIANYKKHSQIGFRNLLILSYSYPEIEYNDTQNAAYISKNNGNKERVLSETEKYGEIIDMTNQNLIVFNNNSYNLRNIKKLRLLNSIEKLKNLENLSYLDLSNNKISILTPLSKLSNLKELYLNNNNISDFSILYSLKKLIHISLKDNNILSIKPSNERILWESLDLSNNKIQIVNNLENFTYLKYLYLNQNNIFSINIKKPLSNLKTLHINKSLITKFNEFYFPSLSELYINDSVIEEIKNCYLMSDLKALSIQSKDCLTKNPLNIKFNDLTNIMELFISNRYILKLEELYVCKNIHTLVLVSCNIKTIPVGIFKNMYELKFLNMSNNNITDIREIIYLKNLEELYLMLMYIKILDIRENPLNNMYYMNIQKQNDIYNDNILPDELTTFNESMIEKGETENLKFLCYYHLIISIMSTSLISLDTFFVTDSDRRKSVNELEKFKNYYEKSLILENEMKESTAVIDPEKFEERININYQFNIIINEFWGYNEIKKYYDHNKEINEKTSDIKYYQSKNNFFDSEDSISEIAINNNKVSDIIDCTEIDNINIQNNDIIEEIKLNNDEIINDELDNDENLNDTRCSDSKIDEINNIFQKNKSSFTNNFELKKCKQKINDNENLNNLYYKNSLIKNASSNKTSENLYNKNFRKSISNNPKVMYSNNKLIKNNSSKETKYESQLNKSQVKILNATINSSLLFKDNQNLYFDSLLKQNSIIDNHKNIKHIKKENPQSLLLDSKNKKLNNKTIKHDNYITNKNINKLNLYNKLNNTNIINNPSSIKPNKNISISLKKAKTNSTLFNRTFKVTLSNPKISIEKNKNKIPTTTEILYKNLHPQKKNIVPTISMNNTVYLKNNVHKNQRK